MTAAEWRANQKNGQSIYTDTERIVLLAPLFAPTPVWTSRSVATQLGVSQSRVARVWREVYSTNGPATWRSQSDQSRLTLCAVYIGGDNSVLVFEAAPHRGVGSIDRQTFMRSRFRPHLQAILAADLLVDEHTAASMRTADRGLSAADIVESAVAGRHDLFVVATHILELPSVMTTGQQIESVVIGADDWQAQLLDLVSRLDSMMLPCVADVHMRVRNWARAPARPFRWLSSGLSNVELPRHRSQRPSLTPSLTDRVITLIQEDIESGLVDPTHRFREAGLAARLCTSRAQLRDALRSLAGEGLVELDAQGRPRVPVPSPADVLETYGARRALGSLIVSRLVSLPTRPASAISAAMARVEEAAVSGDVARAGAADLDFQDTLARLTEMRRIPTMFLHLTAQLRLFISVLGLSYEFSPVQIVDDNSRLVKALLDGDGAAAMEAWRSKVNGAVTYMLDTLPEVTRRDLVADAGREF